MFSDDEQLETDLWSILGQSCDVNSPPASIEAEKLFAPKLSERLASLMIQDARKRGRYSLLSPSHLHSIACATKSAGWDIDIDNVPGVYLFVSLVTAEVLKVGQSGEMQPRIAGGHLRYGTTDSDLVAYCKSRWNWPEAIEGQEITAVLFPMYGSTKPERLCLEAGLQKLLTPMMP